MPRHGSGTGGGPWPELLEALKQAGGRGVTAREAATLIGRDEPVILAIADLRWAGHVINAEHDGHSLPRFRLLDRTPR
jgi:hypothetical protein